MQFHKSGVMTTIIAGRAENEFMKEYLVVRIVI